MADQHRRRMLRQTKPSGWWTHAKRIDAEDNASYCACTKHGHVSVNAR
jgi:hypothetical protein